MLVTSSVSSAAHSALPSEANCGEIPGSLRANEIVEAVVSDSAPRSTATNKFEPVILIDQVRICFMLIDRPYCIHYF